MLHVPNADGAAEAFAEVRPAAEPRLVRRDILTEGPLGDELRAATGSPMPARRILSGTSGSTGASTRRRCARRRRASTTARATRRSCSGSRRTCSRQDQIAAVGIDHCLGGVHLDSRAGPVWRWDDEGRRLD